MATRQAQSTTHQLHRRQCILQVGLESYPKWRTETHIELDAGRATALALAYEGGSENG